MKRYDQFSRLATSAHNYLYLCIPYVHRPGLFIVRLDLVITFHSLSIRRRCIALTVATGTLTGIAVSGFIVARLRSRCWGSLWTSNGTVGPQCWGLVGLVGGNVVVSHTTMLKVRSGGRAGDSLVVGVVVIGLWVFEDNVPCVEETGDVAETAEGKVDDRVGRADSHLDPDCWELAICRCHS